MRNTFLNWYIKGNEEKFTKQIYNIWLTGPTNKFTFFMRLKNLIQEERNYEIKYECKMFLTILAAKFNKYYSHCQKLVLQKWINKNRNLRKI